MEGTKFIKAFCEKTRQYFALEIKKWQHLEGCKRYSSIFG